MNGESHNYEWWAILIQVVAWAGVLTLVGWYFWSFFVRPLREAMKGEAGLPDNSTPMPAPRPSVLVTMLFACCGATVVLVLLPVLVWREVNEMWFLFPVSTGPALLATVAFVRLVRLIRQLRPRKAAAWLTLGGLLTFVTWTPFLILAYRIG